MNRSTDSLFLGHLYKDFQTRIARSISTAGLVGAIEVQDISAERTDVWFVCSVPRLYRPAPTLIENIAIRPVHGQNQGVAVRNTFSVLYMTKKGWREARVRPITKACKQIPKPENRKRKHTTPRYLLRYVVLL